MQVDAQQMPNRPHVLVIHPEDATGDVCRSLLRTHGFEVDMAPDGMKGVYRAYETLPDVILVSAAARELNGYQVCRLLKRDPAMKRVPILLMANGVATRLARFWSVKAGADDFLLQEDMETRLPEKIRMLLDIYERWGLEEKQRLKVRDEKEPFNIHTRLAEVLDTALVESTLMVEFRSLSGLVADVSLLNHMLFSLLESLVDYDAATIFYCDEDETPRKVMLHAPEGETLSRGQCEAMMTDFVSRLNEGVSIAQASEAPDLEIVGAVQDEAPVVAYQTVYAKEIIVDGRLLGAICFYAKEKMHYPGIFPVPLIETEIRLLMKLRRLYARAERLAISDSLTGLFNQKHFLSVFQRELRAAQRYELDLSLALVSVDNLKLLNEERGHVCGNDALRHVAGLMTSSFRNVDIPARFGGRNLALLFPKTACEPALLAMERFFYNLSKSPFHWDEAPLPLTVSCGLASLSPQIASASDLLKQTESALQHARDQGGDRIETHSCVE